MATQGSYKRIDDGLVLHFDAANIKCFRGEPTTNLSQQNVLEKTSTSEYLAYENIAYIFDMNGIGTYTFSFDLKTKRPGIINVYCEDTESQYIKYHFTGHSFTTTTQYQRFTFTREVTVLTPSATSTRISFYGGYGSGIIPSVKNMQIERKDHSTPYTPTSRGTTVATGGGLIDLSNNGNHGELINGVLYDSDNCGSLKFDGVDDYVTVPHNTNQVSINFSICTWIKSTFNNSSLQQLIITKANLLGTEYGWIIRKGKAYRTSDINDNKYYFSTYKNNHARYDATTYSDIEYTDNMWHHVVGVFNGGYYQNIYIDGIKQFASGTAYNDIGMLTKPMPINIQGYGDAPVNYNGTYYSTFQGSISHVLYYNRALSQSEITQIYNSTKSRYL